MLRDAAWGKCLIPAVGLAFLLCYPARLAASDFGITGLLDTPTARMRPDGALTLSVAQQDTVDIYALTFQALPRLEGSFRYAIFNPGKRAAINDTLRDRSFELKLLLLREGARLPALAVGVRDIAGTGVWGSEYVTLSKRLGALDLSLGMGWGRMAERRLGSNPLVQVDRRFKTRSGFRQGETGQLLEQAFFRGPGVGVFGGLAYDLPDWKLSLLAEYNSDAYSRERQRGYFDDTSPWSYGLTWAPLPGLSITGSHQLGHDFALTVTSVLDTKTDTPRKARTPFLASTERWLRGGPRKAPELTHWYDRLRHDAEQSGVLLLSADLGTEGAGKDAGAVAWLEIRNLDYQYPADAIERVLALAEVHLPGQVHTINVVLQQGEVVEATLSYQRHAGQARQYASATGDIISLLPIRKMPASTRYRTRFRIPNAVTALGLASRLQLMDPEDPMRYQLYASLAAAMDLGKGWFMRGALVLNLYNDFGDITRDSNSTLPRVRSEVVRYLKEGESGIQSFYLEKRGMIGTELSYRTYAGLLEEMYSGIGGELLWRRYDRRLALGLNVNRVRQRAYDLRFRHLDYKTTTAHASLYWATPLAGFDLAVHAGRYLARDLGATFELRRTFDNGWMVGAFATLTDVSAEDFGEGSFDKGIFLRIPFNTFFTSDTRASYSTIIRPVQRDGGQRLDNFGTTLWWGSRSSRTDALVRTRARMVPK